MVDYAGIAPELRPMIYHAILLDDPNDTTIKISLDESSKIRSDSFRGTLGILLLNREYSYEFRNYLFSLNFCLIDHDRSFRWVALEFYRQIGCENRGMVKHITIPYFTMQKYWFHEQEQLRSRCVNKYAVWYQKHMKHANDIRVGANILCRFPSLKSLDICVDLLECLPHFSLVSEAHGLMGLGCCFVEWAYKFLALYQDVWKEAPGRAFEHPLQMALDILSDPSLGLNIYWTTICEDFYHEQPTVRCPRLSDTKKNILKWQFVNCVKSSEFDVVKNKGPVPAWMIEQDVFRGTVVGDSDETAQDEADWLTDNDELDWPTHDDEVDPQEGMMHWLSSLFPMRMFQ